MGEKIGKLKEFLEGINAGDIPENLQDKLVELLILSWEEFEGGGETRMGAHKLERIEQPRWHPPIFSFDIERHGAAAMGSTRAEIQDWIIDLDNRTASCSSRGYRQIMPRGRSWTKKEAEQVADELVEKILNGEDDPRYKWRNKQKTTLSLDLPLIIPYYTSLPRETQNGRRKRLFTALEERLPGWTRNRTKLEKDEEQ